MYDRLIEIQKMTPRGEVKEKELNVTKQQLMPQFQERVQKIRIVIHRIEQNNNEIVKLNKKYQSSVESKIENTITAELNKKIIQNKEYNKELESLMKTINAEIQNDKDQKADQNEIRMKTDMQRALNSKAQEVLQETQNVQIQFKQGLKEKITRQTRYIDSTLTEEQLDDICSDPQRANQLMQDKLRGQASMQLEGAVSDIQDKFRDIQKLEESVTQVYQLFLDMATLVQENGEILDDIEQNLTEGKQKVIQGNNDLRKGKKHHMSAKKKKCCILLLLLIIGIVILVPTVLFAG